MTTGLFDKGREKFLGTTTQINWTSDTIKGVLLSSSITPIIGNHEWLIDLAAHTGSLTAQTLATKTTTNGIADADDITFTSVTNGTVWNCVLLYKETAAGALANSPLIAVIGSASATGLPVTASGGNISVSWASTTNRIFKL